MTKDDKFNYWLDIANYDLKTAASMLKSKRYLYVGIMCEQCIEKLIKGLYNFYINDEVPRVHNISYLINKIQKILNIEIDEKYYKLFDKLSAYYLQGRYPSFKEKLSKVVNKKEAELLLKETKEVFKWLVKMKK